MGRFDALTQLEEPKKLEPKPVAKPPSKTQQTITGKTQPIEAKKPTKPQNRFSTNQSPTLVMTEKPEKYTTHILPSLVKKVKLHAVEKEINDYDVINNALIYYFDKNK